MCHIITYISRGNRTTGQAFDARAQDCLSWWDAHSGERPVSTPYKASGCLIWRNRGIGALDLPTSVRAKIEQAQPIVMAILSHPHRWAHAMLNCTYARPRRSRICPTWECSPGQSGTVPGTGLCTATLPEGDFRAVTNPDGAACLGK